MIVNININSMIKVVSEKDKNALRYLIDVGIRSSGYCYDDKVVQDNYDYFLKCFDHNLSPYKALLFLDEYLKGEYIFEKDKH
jgi:hypothetical protein